MSKRPFNSTLSFIGHLLSWNVLCFMAVGFIKLLVVAWQWIF